MSDVEHELGRLSIGLISEPKVAVTRAFLADVLAKLREFKSAAYQRHVCASCGEVSAFEINTARADARPYLALEQARVDRLLFSETAGAAS